MLLSESIVELPVVFPSSTVEFSCIVEFSSIVELSIVELSYTVELSIVVELSTVVELSSGEFLIYPNYKFSKSEGS